MEHFLNRKRKCAKKQGLEIMTALAMSLWLPNPLLSCFPFPDTLSHFLFISECILFLFEGYIIFFFLRVFLRIFFCSLHLLSLYFSFGVCFGFSLSR